MSSHLNNSFWEKWTRTFEQVKGTLMLGIRLSNGSTVIPFISDLVNPGVVKSALSGFGPLFNLLTAQSLPAREQRWAFRKLVVHAIRLPNKTIVMLLHIRNEQQFDRTQYELALNDLIAELRE